MHMEQDPKTLESQELIAANKRLIQDTEEKLSQLDELMHEFRQLYAQQQGISPDEVEAYLAKNMPSEQLAQMKAEFESQVETASAPQGSGSVQQPSPSVRRPRRNIV
jgi:hypothetical protein